MDADKLFTEALGQATAVIKQVQDDQFASATPDDAWSVRDLSHHMLYELSWVPELLEGKTTGEVGSTHEGSLFEDATGLAIAWDRAAVRAENELESYQPDAVVHLSYGDSTAEAYLQEAATDQLIHAWDLGQAIGINVNFERPIAEEVYNRLKNSNLQSSGLFAPPVEVPANADLQTRILAITGRSLDWRSV